MTAKCVMVLGTTSGAGKSWLTTALCRYYARQGLSQVVLMGQVDEALSRMAWRDRSASVTMFEPGGLSALIA